MVYLGIFKSKEKIINIKLHSQFGMTDSTLLMSSLYNILVVDIGHVNQELRKYIYIYIDISEMGSSYTNYI